MAEHRVLTTGQVAALGFGSVITARHRLSALVEIEALRRFRPHREIGSAPWHYLLGPIGAALLGVEDGDEHKWLTAVRRDRQLALERSQRLAHLVGVNWFFASLAGDARGAAEGELHTWLNETATHDWLIDHVPAAYRDYDYPCPDGLGIWAGGSHETVFMLEYETGSEHLPQLTAKLPAYGRLAQSMASASRACPLLLFCFPTPRREQGARRALAACYDTPALRIATAAINPAKTSPAGSVWLPLTTAHPTGQVPLSALDTALPDPWAKRRDDEARRRAGSA